VDGVQVHQQVLLGARRVAALLAHVQLVAALLVGVLLAHAVDLLHVGLQRAALRERLVTQATLVGTHAWGGRREEVGGGEGRGEEVRGEMRGGGRR